MNFKKSVLFFHRWLGWVSGLVVFVVSITGAIFVFEKELFIFFNPSLASVDVPENAQMQPFSTLFQNAQKAVGADKPISIVRISTDRDKSYIFEALKRYGKGESVGWFINEEVIYWDRVFIDPYTGKVLGKIDVEYEFFWIVRQVHQFLYLRRDIGAFIVGTSTLLFIIILISGMILWWPKNRKAARKRLTIRIPAKWKRLNYDLHQVLGFYSFLIALILATTGLVWSFTWWETGIYRILDGKRPDFTLPKPPESPEAQNIQSPALDIVWTDLSNRRNDHSHMYMSITPDNRQLTGILYFSDGSLWSASDLYAYDLRDGSVFASRLQGNKTLGMKWRNSNYDIHVGKVLKFPGMVLALLVCLICASLPVTGFFVWYNRKWGKKRKGH